MQKGQLDDGLPFSLFRNESPLFMEGKSGSW
jgi:hypothetical protein